MKGEHIMANFTREQVIKWNDQAQGGFRLDLSMLITHKEKQLEKYIDVNENKKIRFRLYFSEVYKSYRFSHYEVKLNKSIWNGVNGGAWSSMGLGYSVKINETQYTKKNYKELCNISGQLPQDLETLFTDKAEDCGHGVVLSSPLS